MRRVLVLLAGVVVLQTLALVPALATANTASPAACTPRILVLASMPSELDPLLAAAHLEPNQPVTRSGRHFFIGTLAGKNVVLGMVGIGMINARHMATAAFNGFTCAGKPVFTSVVYSGVAGAGQGTRIADVAAPAQWTADFGKTFMVTPPAMLATARQAAATVKLARATPTGVPGCVCYKPDAVRSVTFPYQPKVVVGGSGLTYDSFNGNEFPCIPGGGDVFGCEPCAFPTAAASDVQRATTDALPFLSAQFITANLGPAASPQEKNYVASDNETGAADQIATAHHVPFIGFRAMSDGTPDPLGLPGYPSQFFVYYQLAAENAATTAVAFVKAWHQ